VKIKKEIEEEEIFISTLNRQELIDIIPKHCFERNLFMENNTFISSSKFK